MASGTAKAALFDALASVAQALGSGRRAEIVDVLAQGERSVEEIAGEISQSVANTSQHLQVLARAGLVRSRREGTRIYLPARERAASASSGRRCATSRFGMSPRCRCWPTSIWASATGSSSSRPRSSRERLARGDVVVLDVRPEAEFRAGHIAGARSAPLPALEELAAKLPRRREIVAYCRGPYCVYADDAVRLLREPRAEGAPAGRRLSGVAAGGAAGRDRELRGDRRCCCARS